VQTTHLKGTIKKRLRPGCGGNLLEQRERHFLRGQKYMQNHKYSEAVIEFENVVHIDPKYPEGFLALGLASRQLGRNDEAVRAFWRCLEINPAQSQGAIELGEIYLARLLAQLVLARDENALGARILFAKSYLAEKDMPSEWTLYSVSQSLSHGWEKTQKRNKLTLEPLHCSRSKPTEQGLPSKIPLPHERCRSCRCAASRAAESALRPTPPPADDARTSMLARVRAAQGPLLVAITLEHGGVQIQTVSRGAFRNLLELPVPHAREKTLALSLPEALEQVSQHCVQGPIGTQQTGVGQAPCSRNHREQERGERFLRERREHGKCWRTAVERRHGPLSLTQFHFLPTPKER